MNIGIAYSMAIPIFLFSDPDPGRPVCLVYILYQVMYSIILVIVYDYSYTIHGI